MKAVENVVLGHVGNCVLAKAPILGVTVSIKPEGTQSAEGLLAKGCGFVSTEEVPMDDTSDLPSILGLLIFLDVLPRGIITKERVQYDINLLHVR